MSLTCEARPHSVVLRKAVCTRQRRSTKEGRGGQRSGAVESSAQRGSNNCQVELKGMIDSRMRAQRRSGTGHGDASKEQGGPG